MIISWCLYIGLLDVTAAVINEKIYRSPTDDVLSANQNITSEQKARSSIDCAGKCSQTDFCSHFYFDKSKDVCHMSNGVITNQKWRAYSIRKYTTEISATTPVMSPATPSITTDTTTTTATEISATTTTTTTIESTTPNIVCPASDGYSVSTENGISLCLKIVVSTTERNDAADNCVFDGGHLISIKNQQEHEFLKSLLVRTANAGDFWVDGADWIDGTSYNFLGWDNAAALYANWVAKTSEPNDNDDGNREVFMRLRKDYDYNFGDRWSSEGCGYVCQIDHTS